MNHKRRKRKSARAGCLMCKPYKHQAEKDRFDAQTEQEKKARLGTHEQLLEQGLEDARLGKIRKLRIEDL